MLRVALAATSVLLIVGIAIQILRGFETRPQKPPKMAALESVCAANPADNYLDLCVRFGFGATDEKVRRYRAQKQDRDAKERRAKEKLSVQRQKREGQLAKEREQLELWASSQRLAAKPPLPLRNWTCCRYEALVVEQPLAAYFSHRCKRWQATLTAGTAFNVTKIHNGALQVQLQGSAQLLWVPWFVQNGHSFVSLARPEPSSDVIVIGYLLELSPGLEDDLLRRMFEAIYDDSNRYVVNLDHKQKIGFAIKW